MEVFLLEMKKNQKSLWIWTISIAIMVLSCMLLFPELKEQAKQVNAMYSSLGSLSQAFGMNKINMASSMGFFAIECGSILGIGGALFCGLLGSGMISKEEHMHTAEFLFTHPRTRGYILFHKFLALLSCIILFYGVNFAISVLSFFIISEDFNLKKLILVFLMQMLLGIEIAGIGFGVSAVLKTSGAGIGIGIGFVFYFMSIYANITNNSKWVKYLTPFSYADPVTVLTKKTIEEGYLFMGMLYLFCALAFSFWYYKKKDIL